MRPLADDHITTIKPYVPGKQVEEIQREYGIDDVVKLASNENPLGPSPKAREVVESRTDRIHVYPDGAAHDLHKALSEFHDRPKDEIIWGNGSDQLLRLAVHAFTRQGEDRGIVSEHSFGAYPIALKSGGVAVDAVGMTGDLEYDLQGMREAVVDDTRMVFIANPNNPTGTYLGGEALRAFLDDLPSDVVALVDEAYYQYARADDYASALTMRDAHERLIVTRTFSKCYGLAGLRVGYAVTTPEITDALNRIRDPFNCNRLGQRAAIAALDDRDFVERSVEVNERGREQLEEGLRGLAGRGVDWTPSQTNFLLVELPVDGEPVYEAMLERGVITRPMHGYGLPEHLRVTIGTEEQNTRFLSAFDAALDEVLV